MMKNILTIALLIISTLGCETVVDITIPVEQPSLVINSALSDKEYIRVNISKSLHILEPEEYKSVIGALVEVYEDGRLLEVLPDSLNGNYVSALNKPKRGKTYEIKVSKPELETATSSVLMPLDTAQILSVKTDTVIISEFGYNSTYLRFSVEILDPRDLENFYDISVYVEGYDKRYDYSVNPPELIDSVYVYFKEYIETKDPSFEEFQSFGTNIIFNDELFNGNTYHINVLVYPRFDNENPEEANLTYYIHLANTSESYYRYEISAQLQYWTSDNPFAQPVTVYNNIENGFGVFGAYNTAVYVVE